MLSQSSAKKKKLSSFHVNESHTLHLSIRHTHTHTDIIRYQKSKYELMDSATKAKSNPHHICWIG